VTQTLLVSLSPGEIRAALVEDDEPIELRIVRDTGAPRAGDLFLGRVVALEPELNAARIEIGAARPAFLDGGAGLHNGEAVLVQVTKEARADKATTVTMRPRLAGAFVDYVPGGGIEIVARGGDEAVRRRVLADVAALAEAGDGFRVRAAAADASPDALAADVAALRRRWRAIEAARAAARAPARLDRAEPPLAALLAAFALPPAQIQIDDRAALPRAAAYAPDTGQAIDSFIEISLSRRVALSNGGALTIDPTSAFVVIDIDSGGAAPMATNLLAARACARHIRLRNLAGPIVIDFITPKDRAQRERVAAALARAFASDPAAPELLGWTRLGHFELVRKRRHPSLDEILFERTADGAQQKTALTVALEALRTLAREAMAQPARTLSLVVAPEVAAVLTDGDARAARLGLETRLGRPVAVTAEPGRPRAAFDIARR
jgi:Ribonuclease G/E